MAQQVNKRGLGTILGVATGTNPSGQEVVWLEVLIGDSSVNEANADAKEATWATGKVNIGRIDPLTGTEQFVNVRGGAKLPKATVAKSSLPAPSFLRS